MAETDRDLAAVFNHCPFREWESFPSRCYKCQTDWSEPVDAWRSGISRREGVDTEFVKWIWTRGYLIHVVPKKQSIAMERDCFVAQLTPKTAGPSSDECFHATRTCNVENILQCGLFPGRECNQSQTKRLDASNYIHVSVAFSDARDWATKEKLLTINVPSILRIDLAAAGTGLLHDPFSTTGYILDTFHVEGQFIQHVA